MPLEGSRAAFHHFNDAESLTLSEPLGLDGCQRCGGADQAKVGASHPAVVHQCVDDLVRGAVDGNCQPEADPGDGRVDPDHSAPAVRQRAPRVAGVDAASVWMTSSISRAAVRVRAGMLRRGR